MAGDTENIPEMKELKGIDIAFLPMNLPYTMTPEMVSDAARTFNPKILYPYHYGETDTSKLLDLLKDTKGIGNVQKVRHFNKPLKVTPIPANSPPPSMGEGEGGGENAINFFNNFSYFPPSP